MEEFKSAYPLIHNKVTSPHYVTPTLRRARLLDWLNANRDARAVVIAAGAGYGKTTLLWQWEREAEFACYWYKLDRNDRDWTLHISYLVEAVSQRHPGFGRRTHSVLRQMGGPGSSRPGVTAFLLAEMHDRLSEPCTFIIDDWQYVASVTEVRGLWNQILRDAPSTCRFVFASRGKPHLQFARFKTHGGYAELRTDELRMTEPEIVELFRDVYRDPLTPDEAAELERRTEGWAASLQLVEVSLRERKTPEERRALIESITATSDTDLFSFLAEEVLEQQTEETRNFLLSTSILQQITPELAERLAGVQDGTRRLLQLEHAGLFTYRLDESRYRYHGLFRDFLERRLADERTDAEVIGLHIHAASFYETSTQWPEAIYHYLRAGLQRQAARLIARYGEDVVTEGRLGMVDGWLQQLPEKTIRDNARLSLLHGEALGIRGEFAAALAALERARDFFARKGDRRMQALALVKLSSVYHLWGQPDTSAARATEGLQIVPDDARDLQLRLHGNVAITSQWLYEPLEGALHAMMRVTAEATSIGLEHYAAIGMHNMGALQLEMGHVAASLKSLERAAEFWNQLPANPFSDNYHLVRAHIAQGDGRRALELARLGELRTRGWARPHVEATCGWALAVADREEWDSALEILRPVTFTSSDLGTVTECARIHFLEIAIQSGMVGEHAAAAADALRASDLDPRLAVNREAVLAVVDHELGRCSLDCGQVALETIAAWSKRGARLQAATGRLIVAPLLMAHEREGATANVVKAVAAVAELGVMRSVRPWLRRISIGLDQLVREGGGWLLAGLVRADPQYWIERVASMDISGLSRTARLDLLQAIERHAQANTSSALAGVAGDDVAAVRARLILRQAPRLFVRTFGSLAIHRGSWDGPVVDLSRRRTRSLLALLIAKAGEPTSRDLLLDALWPDSTPGAAVNSLNQTIFQLRRLIDSSYRDGNSPQYIVSTTDSIQLNPELVRFDWVEALRRAWCLESLDRSLVASYAKFVAEAVRGEFLAEALYDDWAAGPRNRVHDQFRDALLPAVQDVSRPSGIRVQLSQALVSLDAFDEMAHIALARALADSGRRAAGLTLLQQLARRLSDEFDEQPSSELRVATEGIKQSRPIGPQ